MRWGSTWGYIGKSGFWEIEPRFIRAFRYSDALAAVQLDPAGAYGYIDRNGRVAIEPQFTDAEPFAGGLALVSLGTGSWGYVDHKGKLVFESALGGY